MTHVEPLPASCWASRSCCFDLSTTKFVRNKGAVIRHNMGWTFVLLVYLVLIGVACYLFFPGIARV